MLASQRAAYSQPTYRLIPRTISVWIASVGQLRAPRKRNTPLGIAAVATKHPGEFSCGTHAYGARAIVSETPRKSDAYSCVHT